MLSGIPARCARLCAFLAVLLLVGCSGGGKLVPVSGKVLMNDRPLQVKEGQSAAVNFHPDTDKGNQYKGLGAAPVNENGEYTLTNNGVPPGWYKVTVTYSKPSNPKDPYSVPVSLIAADFNSKEKTPLAVEVKEGTAPDAYTLKVK